VILDPLLVNLNNLANNYHCSSGLRANRLTSLGHAYLTIERFPRSETKQGRCKPRLLCHSSPIDSHYSHVAWVRNIQEKFGVEIPFPIIADLSMEVAKAYGMIHPGAADTSAVRATFIIDPEGVLRAMVYYPMSNGRSIDEFVRLVKAMQTSDANGVATSEAWQPGDKVIVPPPATTGEAQARAESGEYECTDWYFCKKAI